MALKKSFVLPNGLLASDAYWRVEYPVIYDKTRVQFTLIAYNGTTEVGTPDGGVARVAGARVGEHIMEFELDLESTKNLYVQAYEYVKSRPDFESAMDC